MGVPAVPAVPGVPAVSAVPAVPAGVIGLLAALYVVVGCGATGVLPQAAAAGSPAAGVRAAAHGASGGRGQSPPEARVPFYGCAQIT
ncbi:MAG: hypothetical protein ACLGI5_08310 [Thermoleophilia bacterium]